MGCASSSPIVEGGKNLVEGAKETVSDTINKGEKALQDVGDTAKEGFQTVKETMHNAANNAERGMDNVIGKIGDTFNFHAKETLHQVEEKKDDMVNDASEVVSQAETVLASETESAKDAFQTRASAIFETVHSFENEMETKAEEVKKETNDVLEDLENDLDQTMEFLGDNVVEVERKFEELNEHHLEDNKAVEEIKKEEPPPTFWEAAADAYLLRKTVKSMDFHSDFDKERNFFTQPQVYDVDNGTEANVNDSEANNKVNQLNLRKNDVEY